MIAPSPEEPPESPEVQAAKSTHNRTTLNEIRLKDFFRIWFTQIPYLPIALSCNYREVLQALSFGDLSGETGRGTVRVSPAFFQVLQKVWMFV